MGLNESGDNMIMPVAPMYGGYGGNNGMFGNGNDWWILLFLFAFWGNGNWGNGGVNGNAGSMLPYFTAQNTDAAIQRGFDQSAVTGQLSSISTALTNGFASAEVAACNRDLNQIKATYDSEIASMNQRFGDVTALNAAINGVANSLQNCCCENRAGVADLKYTVATEACADRAAVTDALTTTLNTINNGLQSIKDQMCQDKIDAKNERIAELQQQLYMKDLAASQTAQTAQLLADNSRQTSVLEDYLNPVPRPAYIVSNPNGCNCMNSACGSF
jgi:hypothetical protein